LGQARTEIFLRQDLDIEIANGLSGKSGEQAQELRAMGYTETGDHDNRLREGGRWKQEIQMSLRSSGLCLLTRGSVVVCSFADPISGPLVSCIYRGSKMSGEHPELDELQSAYKSAVDIWISSIRKEEALASVNHSVADLDQWEKAHFEEEKMRNAVKTAKEKYEDALRAKFFGF
jgi:hypothetical protein